MLAVLAGCATVPQPVTPSPVVHAQILRHIPERVTDRSGWAGDIQTAFATRDIAPNDENICAVLAVIEQESGYQADPAVANLPAIAGGEIKRRAAALHVPGFMVDAALKIRSTDGRSYADRLKGVRTERELSGVYEDLIGRVPLGHRLFAGHNPVQTGGPMQVSIPFAESMARGYPYPVSGSIRDEVFTRRGGLYFGIVHLLGYPTPYTRKVHRFADFNAGWYASRNAAFQNAVAVASGRKLALDGDVLNPGAPLDRPGETEQAVRSLAGELAMDNAQIRSALKRADRLDFNDSRLFTQVFVLAERRAGKALPREMLPGIKLESPKISRELTTAWFATRVNDRYQRCMTR
ncbi:MAG: DUF1615 domain-containing protein [Dokdonella sp.]